MQFLEMDEGVSRLETGNMHAQASRSYLTSPFPHSQGQPVVNRLELLSILSDFVSVLKKQTHAFGKGPLLRPLSTASCPQLLSLLL